MSLSRVPQIEQHMKLGGVRVLDVLLDMRKYRMGLIQTPEQLRFSYLAILDGAQRLLDEHGSMLAMDITSSTTTTYITDDQTNAGDDDDGARTGKSVRSASEYYMPRTPNVSVAT